MLWGCVELGIETTPPKIEALDEPTFSHASGFHDTNINVALAHTDPTAAVYYTTDGSDPDPDNVSGTSYRYKMTYPRKPSDPFGPFFTQRYQSFRYKQRILVSDRSSEPDRIARISTTLHAQEPDYVTPLAPASAASSWGNEGVDAANQRIEHVNRWLSEQDQLPKFQMEPIRPIEPTPQARLTKGTVLRAMAVKKNGQRSAITTATYFIMPRKTFSLPVVSLVTQEDRLFGYDNGVLVAGKAFDDHRRLHPTWSFRGGNVPANWHARGEDIPAHFQFFSHVEQPNTASMDQRIGIRVHGGFSRANPSKSLRLYARKRYGKNKFQHPIFGEDHNQKKLILRNSGNDFQSTLFRDGAVQKMVENLNIETQGYQPTTVFLNGEYWGILNAREYFDSDFFSEKYNVADKHIELVENGTVVEGDAAHWQQVTAFFQGADLSDTETYLQAGRLVDIDSFIDHQIANILVANVDWPHNNVKAWRYSGKATSYNNKGVLDGRWRWLLYDTDLALFSPAFNSLASALGSSPTRQLKGTEPSTLMLRRFMQNRAFKTRFINRFADLLNTTFDPAQTTATIKEQQRVIEPEMARHLARWKAPTDLAAWNHEVNKMLIFVAQRPALQRRQLMEQFQIPKTYALQLNLPDPAEGSIRINTLLSDDLSPSNTGSRAWTGSYFAGVPLELEAIAKPCYAFKRWEGLAAERSRAQITPGGDIQAKAVFEPACGAVAALSSTAPATPLPNPAVGGPDR